MQIFGLKLLNALLFSSLGDPMHGKSRTAVVAA